MGKFTSKRHRIKGMIPRLLMYFGLLVVGSIIAQPVQPPQLNAPAFNSQDLNPILGNATASGSQSAWEAIVGGGLAGLRAAWENQINAQINAELLNVTQSDSVNSQAEYQNYVRSALVSQKSQAEAAWVTAAENAIASERQTFIAALRENDVRKAQQDAEEQKAAILAATQNVSPNSNVFDSAKQALEKAEAKYEKNYQNQLDYGLGQYNSALSAVDGNFQAFLANLTQTDNDFQQNLLNMQGAEQNVRNTIATQVASMQQYLQQSGQFYVQNCDANGQNCTSSGTLNQEGTAFAAVIASMQTALQNNAPLSQVTQLMVNYMDAQAQTAAQNVAYWQPLIDNDYNDTTPFTSTYNTHSCFCVLFFCQTCTDWDNPGFRNNNKTLAAHEALANGNYNPLNNLLGGPGKTVTYSALAMFTSDYIYDDGSIPYANVSLSNFMDYANCIINDCMNPPWIQRQPPWIQLNLAYHVHDHNAESNFNTWTGYKTELNASQTAWNGLLDAVTNWEAQVSQYQAQYAAWIPTRDQQALDAQQSYVTATEQIVGSRSAWLNEMETAHTRAKAQWQTAALDLQAAQSSTQGASAEAQREAAKNALASIPVIAPFAAPDLASLNSIVASVASAPATSVNANQGVADASQLAGLGQEFGRTLGGLSNLAIAAQSNTDAIEFQKQSLDTMIQQAKINAEFAHLSQQHPDWTQQQISDQVMINVEKDSADYKVTQKNGMIVVTRQIATGAVAFDANADLTDINSYRAVMGEQSIYVNGPATAKLAQTGSLFTTWDMNSFATSQQEARNQFDQSMQQLDKEFAAADRTAQQNMAKFHENAEKEVEAAQANAAQMQSLLQAFLPGGGGLMNWAKEQLRSQVSDALGQAWGLPPGLIGNMLSGMKPAAAFKAYAKSTLENQMWDAVGTAIGDPGLVSAFRQLKSQQDAAKAKAKAKKAATVQAVATVAAVVAAPFTGGASIAAMVAISAAKGAITGAAGGGGIKGALAGAVGGAISGAISTVTTNVGLKVDVNLSYSKENGFGAGVSVGDALGLASVGVGVSQKGGVTANARVGYDLGGGNSLGLGLNYSKNEGFGANVGVKMGNVNLGVNYSQSQGASAYLAAANKQGSAGLSYSKAEGVGAYVQKGSVETGAGKLSFTENQGLTASVQTKHGSLSYNEETGATVAIKADLGDGNSGTLSYNSKTGFGAAMHIVDSVGLSADIAIDKNGVTSSIDLDRSVMLNNMGVKQGESPLAGMGLAKPNDSLITSQAEMEARGASMANKIQQEETLRSKTDWLKKRPDMAGKSAAELAEIVNDPKRMHELGVDKMNKEGVNAEGINAGGTRESFLDNLAGEFKDLGRGLAGQLSDPNGYVDENGQYKQNTCFVAGTLVKTATGFKKIEDIKVGDTVASFNEMAQKLEYKRVRQTFVRKATYTYFLGYDSGTQVQTTGDHPFMIERKGWTKAARLKIGDDSLLATEVSRPKTEIHVKPVSWKHAPRGVIVAIRRDNALTTVYNFEVEGNHTYLVSEDEIVVHNQCKPEDVNPASTVISMLQGTWREYAPDWLQDLDYDRQLFKKYDGDKRAIAEHGRGFNVGAEKAEDTMRTLIGSLDDDIGMGEMVDLAQRRADRQRELQFGGQAFRNGYDEGFYRTLIRGSIINGPKFKDQTTDPFLPSSPLVRKILLEIFDGPL